jgi:hypothetical protein
MRNVNPYLSACVAARCGADRAGSFARSSPTGAAQHGEHAASASGAKIVSDPTSVVMIVDRDSNDIAFMDIKTKQILGRTFLGNNVNPHMVMMSPDGRYVVTGGQRSNTAYIIASRSSSSSRRSRWAARASRVLAGRTLVLPGQPEGDSITVIDMQSLKAIKTIEGLAERQHHVHARRLEGVHRQLRCALRASST